MNLGVFYGNQNFFIFAWVFWGGSEITNLTIKKCQKNFAGNLRCLTEYEKTAGAMSKSRKLHGLPILFSRYKLPISFGIAKSFST